jgi:hypothetical protein
MQTFAAYLAMFVLYYEDNFDIWITGVKLNMFIYCLIEAMDAIILHSATPESVLLRKRLSREILFRYLHNKKVPTIPTDKRTMISKILQMWNCTLHDNEVIKLSLVQWTQLN